jgi:hypothetical protein
MLPALISLLRLLQNRCTDCGGELLEYSWKFAYCYDCGSVN